MKRTAAFSLVECALALGIVSFVLVSMLGLLPVGLAAFRESINDTIRAQIVETVVSRLREHPFATLSNQTYYFDSEGSATDQSKAALSAEVIVAETNGDALESTHLKRLEIRISPVGVPHLQLTSFHPMLLSETGHL